MKMIHLGEDSFNLRVFFNLIHLWNLEIMMKEQLTVHILIIHPSLKNRNDYVYGRNCSQTRLETKPCQLKRSLNNSIHDAFFQIHVQVKDSLLPRGTHLHKKPISVISKKKILSQNFSKNLWLDFTSICKDYWYNLIRVL